MSYDWRWIGAKIKSGIFIYGNIKTNKRSGNELLMKLKRDRMKDGKGKKKEKYCWRVACLKNKWKKESERFEWE